MLVRVRWWWADICDNLLDGGGAAWPDDLSLSPWTRNSSQSLLCTPPRSEEEKGGFKGVSRSAVGFAGAGWGVG